MDVRTEILEVSLKLFNEFGSESISTNEIAKKTDISTGTLYYYFKNKEEIILELFIKLSVSGLRRMIFLSSFSFLYVNKTFDTYSFHISEV